MKVTSLFFAWNKQTKQFIWICECLTCTHYQNNGETLQSLAQTYTNKQTLLEYDQCCPVSFGFFAMRIKLSPQGVAVDCITLMRCSFHSSLGCRQRQLLLEITLILMVMPVLIRQPLWMRISILKALTECTHGWLIHQTVILLTSSGTRWEELEMLTSLKLTTCAPGVKTPRDLWLFLRTTWMCDWPRAWRCNAVLQAVVGTPLGECQGLLNCTVSPLSWWSLILWTW